MADLLRKKRFLRAEKKAIHAWNIQDYESARDHYAAMLDIAKGWLALKDPNMLWVRAHYSECLMHTGDNETADKLQHEILKDIVPPETEDEADAIVEVLHLRVAVVNKLHARGRTEEALMTMRRALYLSKKSFGDDDENTESLQMGYNKIEEQIMSRQLPRLRTDHRNERSRRRQERLVDSTDQASLSDSDTIVENYACRDDVVDDISDARLLSATASSDFQEQVFHIITDKWFAMYLKRVHDLFRCFSPVKHGARPKIAILDTGLNTKHPDVSKIHNPEDRSEKRIKGLWAPKSQTWSNSEDVDGHGTHCAMVANKVAPNADIYVLRVFEDRHHVSGKHIVEAVHHAVYEWQVDIISMSFAINKDDHSSKAAITEKLREVKDKVLIFAAASNAGLLEGRTYPAKRPEVVAVHAAHGSHEPYKKNPPLFCSEWNITALGMYVLAPHKNASLERLSGTSVACAVAAGIAALVLEFCRRQPLSGEASLRDPSVPVSNDGPLRLSKKGMLRIFQLMRLNNREIKEPGPGEILCLMPWELLSLERGDGKPDAARKIIASDIATALRDLKD
ncbi:Major intracellular serine protease [Cyphellophora attinorum]|uniref:Major intracellular serine protease n=1 Tax=Cyphellophora attinorum TaxID=1664694 RepID=A0A0N1P2C3_9EURO|nr:Major intracellular serine protease [Phialophora attinorum]KPI45625.1 Major intracellular serine protease [Phialophora attinorum]